MGQNPKTSTNKWTKFIKRRLQKKEETNLFNKHVEKYSSKGGQRENIEVTIFSLKLASNYTLNYIIKV